MSRALAAALLILLLSPLLVACDLGSPSRMSKQIAAQQSRDDPPQLWRVQQFDSRDALIRTVDICVAKVHLRHQVKRIDREDRGHR